MIFEGTESSSIMEFPDADEKEAMCRILKKSFTGDVEKGIIKPDGILRRLRQKAE